jgi:ferrous iron transport protein B
MTTVAEKERPVGPKKRLPLVALLGNPNTGKSTIFNRLTGLRQRIANYPGITIEAHKGEMVEAGQVVEILDLPGTYSLTATSPEERVTIDVLSGHGGREKPDLVVCILDATNLKRNLFLASQLAEFGRPMLLVLNQWDVARKRGLQIDVAALEEELGVPVVCTVGTRGEGLADLRKAMAEALQKPRTMRRLEWEPALLEAGQDLCQAAAAAGDELDLSEAHRLLFDANSSIKQRLRMPAAQLAERIEEGRRRIRATGLNPGAAEAILHYAHLDRVLSRVLPAKEEGPAGGDHFLDALLVHRIGGTIIFVGVMWLVFQAVYAWAGPLMDLIEAGTGWAQELAAGTLEATPVFQSLVADGVIAGVGSVVIFLPQIFILFFCIAVLEDSGYMSRAAFLMDKLFGWCGLNGKSFVPLLSSYACAIPGIMAARALEDPKARMATVLMAPFMSCSARLPVYVLLIGAFVEPEYGAWVAGWMLFAMHFVGLVVALPLVWFLNRVILRVKPLPFILEMSAYKMPDWRNVFLKMWEGGREFLLRAGTIIFAFSVVIWALLYFPRSEQVEARVTEQFLAEQSGGATARQAVEEELEDPASDAAQELEQRLSGAYLEDSYLGRFGRTVQPIFAPAGFDWKITVGVLASFPAREVIIATMGIIYNLGPEVDEESEGLRERMARETWSEGPLAGQPVFTIPVVVALMVFFALCLQCGSTVAVMAKQLNWSWALGAFFGMTAMAWLAAVLIYQVGSRLLGPGV